MSLTHLTGPKPSEQPCLSLRADCGEPGTAGFFLRPLHQCLSRPLLGTSRHFRMMWLITPAKSFMACDVLYYLGRFWEAGRASLLEWCYFSIGQNLFTCFKSWYRLCWKLLPARAVFIYRGFAPSPVLFLLAAVLTWNANLTQKTEIQALILTGWPWERDLHLLGSVSQFVRESRVVM